MNNILVLGSGLVSRPGVKYLLERDQFNVTVASLMLDAARELVAGHENGKAVYLDVDDTGMVVDLIQTNDIVISLLPWTLHEKIALLCLEHNKHFVTASYTADWMYELDEQVKAKGLVFLNEIGVDPGIDHMSAMKVIDEVKAEGGKVLHFYSNTGGLPAPEDNNNPFGYKFSWSPKGVLLASRNSARWLEDGQIVEIPGEELFSNYLYENVEPIGRLEVYPNRDSVPYKDLYGLDEALTVKRGTYRYPGWCDTIKKMIELGLLSEKAVSNGISFKAMLAQLLNAAPDADVKSISAKTINQSAESEIIQRLEWLGLFSDQIIPDFDNVLDVLCQQMQDKMNYEDGEKDMIVMRHLFTVENADQTRDQITSTLIDYGIPGGDSSMARTVSLPLAIAVRMIAEGRFKSTGVQIPTIPEIYTPVLAELAELGIAMDELRTALK